MNLENAYALLIGVGGYDLPVTVKDAEAIGQILANPKRAGYRKENITILTEEHSTRENVLQSMQGLVNTVSKKKNSTVIIYYSGHGGIYNNEGIKEYYLLTHGFDSNDRANTMVNGEEFSNLINQIQAEKVLVMLDCCHASGMLDGGKVIKLKSPDNEIVNSNVELLKKLKTGVGKVFVTSCDDDEQSVILPNSKNSLFTEVVLEALDGYATKDSYVSMIDLLYHVLNEVPKRVKKHNHVQRPIVNRIESLSPDYYICRASVDSKVINREVLTQNIEDEIIKLIKRYNLDHSHQPINLEKQTKNDDESKVNILISIETFMSQGSTDKAIEMFVDSSKSFFNEYKSQSFLLAHQYNSVINDKMIGIIDDTSYRTQMAKINHSLLFYVNEARKDIDKTL